MNQRYALVLIPLLLSCGARDHPVEPKTITAQPSTLPTTVPSLQDHDILDVLAKMKAPWRFGESMNLRWRYVRAEISESQWLQIRQQLEKEWTPGKGWNPSWDWAEPDTKPDWWNPSSTNSGSYWVQRPDYRQAMKFEGGFLYYWEVWE